MVVDNRFKKSKRKEQKKLLKDIKGSFGFKKTSPKKMYTKLDLMQASSIQEPMKNVSAIGLPRNEPDTSITDFDNIPITSPVSQPKNYSEKDDKKEENVKRIFELRTDYDSVLEFVNKIGFTNDSEIVKNLGISKKLVNEILRILDDEKMLKLHYPLIGGIRVMSLQNYSEKSSKKTSSKKKKKSKKKSKKKKTLVNKKNDNKNMKKKVSEKNNTGKKKPVWDKDIDFEKVSKK